jgi:ABC-type lipoprotein release transport system permease subunit
VIVASLLAIIELLASWIPAHKTVGLDPLEAIRYE